VLFSNLSFTLLWRFFVCAEPGSCGKGAVTWIAMETEGFSGSDLVELCSEAAKSVLSEYWTAKRWEGGEEEGRGG
jgi:hypothetical protein